VAAGLTAGLIGGLTAFIMTGGWATVLATTINKSEMDIRLLAEVTPHRQDVAGELGPAGGRQNDAAQTLLRRYPDLQALPAEQRLALLREKIISDIGVGIPVGIWLGILFTLLSFGLFGTCGTILASVLMRRHGSVRHMILPYLEGTIPAAWLILFCYLQLFYQIHDANPLFVLSFAALACAAWAGILRDWPVYLRASWYAAGIAAVLRLAQVHIPWLMDVFVYLVAAVVIIRHGLLQRRLA